MEVLAVTTLLLLTVSARRKSRNGGSYNAHVKESSNWLTVTDSTDCAGTGVPEPIAGLLPEQLLGNQSMP